MYYVFNAFVICCSWLFLIEDLSGLRIINDYILNLIQRDPSFVDLDKLLIQYPVGEIVEAQISSIQNYGIFVEFGLNATGFARISTFDFNKEAGDLFFENYENGQIVKIEILKFNHDHKRFAIKIIDNEDE